MYWFLYTLVFNKINPRARNFCSIINILKSTHFIKFFFNHFIHGVRDHVTERKDSPASGLQCRSCQSQVLCPWSWWYAMPTLWLWRSQERMNLHFLLPWHQRQQLRIPWDTEEKEHVCTQSWLLWRQADSSTPRSRMLSDHCPAERRNTQSNYEDTTAVPSRASPDDTSYHPLSHSNNHMSTAEAEGPRLGAGLLLPCSASLRKREWCSLQPVANFWFSLYCQWEPFRKVSAWLPEGLLLYCSGLEHRAKSRGFQTRMKRCTHTLLSGQARQHPLHSLSSRRPYLRPSPLSLATYQHLAAVAHSSHAL